MNLFTLSLAGEIICVGLFSGLMFTLIFIVQPMLNSLSATEYAFFVQRFLKFAHKNAGTTVIIFAAALLPIPALITTWIGSLAFILTILGWLIFIVGVIAVTIHVNAPLYRIIELWDVKSPVPDWEQTSKKWYRLNCLRGLAAGIAFLHFLTALVLPR